jgi:hypothetical protein
MNEDRVVDIWFDASRSYGSGYLLSDRLVLTARHVFKPLERLAPCIVRQRDWANEPLAGKVEWFSTTHDAGLVLLDRPVERNLGSAPAFGRAPTGLGSSNGYPCRAIGFPRASKSITNLRIDKPITGVATLLVRAGTFDFVTDTRPARNEDWAGFSGAALFRDDLLFAVVSEVPTAWGGGTLTALAVDLLLDDPGFRKILTDCGVEIVTRKLRYATFYADLWKKLFRYCHYVDREDQLRDFRDFLGEDANCGLIFGGTREDCPEFLVWRLAEMPEFRRIIGDMDARRAVPQLKWPTDYTIADPDAALRTLAANCALLLCLPPCAAENADAFAVELRKRPAAALWWEINATAMGPGHSTLLSLWVDFCEAVQAKTPLYWFAYWLNVPEAPRRDYALFQRARPSNLDMKPFLTALIETRRAVPLGELASIDPTHLSDWLEAVRLLVPFDDEDRVEISDRIRNQFDALPLGAFTRLVEARLRGADA